ncbi:glutaredoxin 3 [Parvularcula bermudensis]
MQSVIMYTTPMCPYCARARRLLEEKGATIEEKRAGLNVDLKNEMIEKSGGARTFPQIFIGDTHVGGCDDLMALNEEGKLDRQLAGDR